MISMHDRKVVPGGRSYQAAFSLALLGGLALVQNVYYQIALVDTVDEDRPSAEYLLWQHDDDTTGLFRQEQSFQKLKQITRGATLTSSAWTRLPPIPKRHLEGSCVWHRQELWCISSFGSDEVVSFSPQTQQWTKRPSLMDVAHHTFSSAFSVRQGSAILQVGGLSSQNSPRFKTQWLDTSSDNTTEWAWQSGDNITNAHDQDVGGAVGCTTIPVHGLHFCVFASDLFFTVDTPRFFSLCPVTLQFTSLPIPAEIPTHPTLLADPIRGRVILLCHRNRGPATNLAGSPSSKIHIYNVEKRAWVVSNDELPEFMVSADARGFWQDEMHGYFFGGQNDASRYVTDMIYKFSLSPDPSIESIALEPWSRLPHYGLLGPSIAHDPAQGSDQLYVIGGSNACGPHYRFDAWLWEKNKRETLTAYEVQRKTQIDTRRAPRLHVTAANFGRFDVTSEVQILLDAGWTNFRSMILPSLSLPEKDQWVEGSWPFLVNLANRTYVTGHASQSLIITIQEEDGRRRLVLCPDSDSGCRLSWWNEVDEAANKIKNRPTDWMEERALLSQM